MTCDGLRVRVVLSAFWWLVLVCVVVSAVGVRMARIGFSAIDIYLYTDGAARDCGAFSRSCGGLWLVACVVICMDICKACSVSYGVYMYLCIYIMRLWLVWWCLVVCSCIYR